MKFSLVTCLSTGKKILVSNCHNPEKLIEGNGYNRKVFLVEEVELYQPVDARADNFVEIIGI